MIVELLQANGAGGVAWFVAPAGPWVGWLRAAASLPVEGGGDAEEEGEAWEEGAGAGAGAG